MPPSKKNTPVPASKQQSIKEALAGKKRQHPNIEEEQSDSLRVIKYMNDHEDIRTDSYDTISNYARVWFREHSNINDILNKFIETFGYRNPNKAAFLNQIIRAVTSSAKARREFPFNEFKYDSVDNELIGRYLLMHPQMNTTVDLQDTIEFHSDSGIKLSRVDMTINNKFGDDCKNFIEKKRRKHGSEKLPVYFYRAPDFALETYYREHSCQELYDLQTITLEELCDISTFKRSVRKSLPDDTPSSIIASTMETKLEMWRESPEMIDEDGYFVVHPKFVFIINNITSEQSKLLKKSQERFYSCSNARNCALENKRFIPAGNPPQKIPPSDDPVERKKEREHNFYLMYVRTNAENRRKPPFHWMLWNKKCKISVAKQQQQVVNEISSSSEMNEPKPNAERSLEEFTMEPNIESHEVEIVRLMFMDKTFINTIKNQTRVKYPESFPSVWSKFKKRIVSNFILEALRSENQSDFKRYMDYCSPETRLEIYAHIDSHEGKKLIFAEKTKITIFSFLTFSSCRNFDSKF
jgi:hypothetical protein